MDVDGRDGRALPLVRKKVPVVILSLCAGWGAGLFATDAAAQTSACDLLKTQLNARLPGDPATYTLEAVPRDAPIAAGGKVVGNCEGGAFKMVYRRGVPAAAQGAASAASVVERTAPALAVPARSPPRVLEPMPVPVPASAPGPVALADPAASSAVSLAGGPSFIARVQWVKAWRWDWLLLLLALPVAGGLGVWAAHRRRYDAAGLPRGPRL